MCYIIFNRGKKTMIFDCFGYSLEKYGNEEIHLVNNIKRKYVNNAHKIQLLAFNNTNVRYWVIPENNLEYYLFFDENFNNVGWDFISNTGVVNKFKVTNLHKNLSKDNGLFGFGFVQVESSLCPLNMCVVNYDSLNDGDIGNMLEFECTIFTEEIEVYKNENDFNTRQDRETKLAPESIIPTGMFPGRRPDSIWLNGKVVNIQKYSNDFAYYSMVVESHGIRFNVFTTEKIGKSIKVGNILSVQGQLFSKTLKKPMKVFNVQ